MAAIAQANLEYLIAIGLSFFLTLGVFVAILGMVASARENITCTADACKFLQYQKPPEQKLLENNVLFYILTLLAIYFVEFCFILLFLKYVSKPEEKQKLQKHSKY